MEKPKRPVNQNISRIMGENLKSLRQLHQMTQQDLATKLQISYQQIQKYESGKNRIPIESLITLKELFHVPYDFFLKGISKEERSSSPSSFLLSLRISKLIENVKNEHERKKILKVVDILCS